MAIKTFTCTLYFLLLVFLSTAQKSGSVEITIENDAEYVEWADWEFKKSEVLVEEKIYQKFNSSMTLIFDSLPAGKYTLTVKKNYCVEDSSGWTRVLEDYLMLTIDIVEGEHLEIYHSVNNWYDLSETSEETNVAIGTHFGWNDRNNFFSRVEYEFEPKVKSKTGWFLSFGQVVGYQGGKLRVDSMTFDEHWTSETYWQNYFYVGPALSVGKEWNIGNQTIDFGLRCAYRFPLYTAARSRSGNKVFKEQRIHDYNDFRAGTFISFSVVKLRLTHRFFDFIESPYGQMPDWELGLVIGG